MSKIPMRIDKDLFDHARVTGWELESAPAVSRRDIERVLASDGSYDELSEREQAMVRATWEQCIEGRIAALDLEAEFTAAGRSWTDADATGNIVNRTPEQPEP